MLKWFYCLTKPAFTFCAYVLVAFTDLILIPPSSPSSTFTRLIMAPSHEERKRAEDGSGRGRINAGKMKKYREIEGCCMTLPDNFFKYIQKRQKEEKEIDIGSWWIGGKKLAQESSKSCENNMKLRKWQAFFRFKEHMVYPEIID